MPQPVTSPGSSELASQLEELSGLASQIVRFSDELRTVSQSDTLLNGASVCALLSPALSNARSCLSVLRRISQTPISPPPSLPFVPPALTFTPTPTTPEPARPVPPSSPAHVDVDVEMKQEEAVADALLALAEPRYGRLGTVVDCPFVDPRFSAPGPPQPTIGMPGPPAVSLEPSFPSRHTPPPTQRWPLSAVPPPPFGTTFKNFTQTPGGRLNNVSSPSSPLFSHFTPGRRSVPLAELVDEEGLSPSTRGGVRSFSLPAATRANMLLVQSYPPLSISFADVTPTPTKPSDFFTSPAPTPLRSPLTSPTRNDRCDASGEGSRTPRRSKRKGAPLTGPEVPDRRITRSISIKGTTAEGSRIRSAPSSKRARTSFPEC